MAYRIRVVSLPFGSPLQCTFVILLEIIRPDFDTSNSVFATAGEIYYKHLSFIFQALLQLAFVVVVILMVLVSNDKPYVAEITFFIRVIELYLLIINN